MALNSAIILQGRPAEIQNPLVSLAQGEQLRGTQTRNKLLDMQLQQEQQNQADQRALSDLTRAAYDPETGSVDPSKIRAGLAQSGNYAGLQNFETKQLAQQKAQRDADKARLEGFKQTLDLQGQLLGGVRDQQSYQSALQIASQNGLDVSQLPPVYDPNVVDQLRAKTLTVSQQLDQQWKQKGYDKDVAALGETMRHNQVGEGLTAQGQQITMRGQDMTDQRARDTLTQNAANKAPTEFQGKSAGYGARAEEASRLIEQLGSAVSPMAVNVKQAVGRVPLIGGALEAGANAALSPQNQQLEQAQRDFVNAVLRQESGAAISQGEFENAKRQYFPQPGDSPQVIAQKAANRKLAIEGFRRSAGKAAFSAPGSTAKPSLTDIFGN